MRFREHNPALGDIRGATGGNNFPKIFQLIDSKASAQEIVQQIYADFYSSDRDQEKLFLGFQDLLMRGSEEEAILRFISQDKGELGQIALKLLNNPPANSDDLELEFGVDRKSGFIDANLTLEDLNSFKEIYKRAVDLGVFHGELKDFIKYMVESSSTVSSGHFDDSIEKEIVCKSSTFGRSEASYLELLGPRKILETRALKQPKFLLLGSLMQYSAREFSYFVKKLNPSAEPTVLDVDPMCVQACARYQGENGLQVVPGDALDIPMGDESFDQVYTNHLFHFLVTHGIGSDNKINVENISELFKEVSRVLKPGGSFLIDEQPFGIYATLDGTGKKEFFKAVQSYANRAGLRVVNKRENAESIFFRSQIINVDKGIPGVKINDNGFPHYEDITVWFDSNTSCITLRFEKIANK